MGRVDGVDEIDGTVEAGGLVALGEAGVVVSFGFDRLL